MEKILKEKLKGIFGSKDIFIKEDIKDEESEKTLLISLKNKIEKIENPFYYKIFFPNSKFVFLFNKKAQEKLNFFPSYLDIKGCFNPFTDIEKIKDTLHYLKVQILAKIASNVEVNLKDVLNSIIDTIAYIETFKTRLEELQIRQKIIIFDEILINTENGEAFINTLPNIEYNVLIDESTIDKLSELYQIIKKENGFIIKLYEKMPTGEYKPANCKIYPKKIKFTIFYNSYLVDNIK